jgi:hypothetical protein
LINYTGDLPTENFVIVPLGADAFDADVRAEVNWISNAAVSPPQGNLERCIAVSEKNTSKACTRVGEGQLSGARHHLFDFTDGTAKFVCHSHSMCLGTQFRREHVSQLKLNSLAYTSQFTDGCKTRQPRRNFTG